MTSKWVAHACNLVIWHASGNQWIDYTGHALSDVWKTLHQLNVTWWNTQRSIVEYEHIVFIIQYDSIADHRIRSSIVTASISMNGAKRPFLWIKCFRFSEPVRVSGIHLVQWTNSEWQRWILCYRLCNVQCADLPFPICHQSKVSILHPNSIGLCLLAKLSLRNRLQLC